MNSSEQCFLTPTFNTAAEYKCTFEIVEGTIFYAHIIGVGFFYGGKYNKRGLKNYDFYNFFTLNKLSALEINFFRVFIYYPRLLTIVTATLLLTFRDYAKTDFNRVYLLLSLLIVAQLIDNIIVFI